MDYQAVVFDFDYTLGDATESIYAGFVRGMEAMGLPVPTVEAVRQTVGMKVQDAFTALTGDADEGRRQAFYQVFHPIAKELQAQGHVSLFPGAAELLEALRAAGIHAAVVSTKNSSTLEVVLTQLGVRHTLDYVVGGDMVAVSKPNPEGLLWVIGQLKLPKRAVLYCGDTVIDARTAQNAGVDFAAVLNGTTPAATFDSYPHVFVAGDLPALGHWLGM